MSNRITGRSKRLGPATSGLAVTNGTTTVDAVGRINFTSGATVSDLGSGEAGVAITGGGGGGGGGTDGLRTVGPFAFTASDIPNNNDQVDLWTPTADTILYDVLVAVDTAFDGTADAKFETSGMLFGSTTLDLTQASDVGSNGEVALFSLLAASAGRSADQAQNFTDLPATVPSGTPIDVRNTTGSTATGSARAWFVVDGGSGGSGAITWVDFLALTGTDPASFNVIADEALLIVAMIPVGAFGGGGTEGEYDVYIDIDGIQYAPEYGHIANPTGAGGSTASPIGMWPGSIMVPISSGQLDPGSHDIGLWVSDTSSFIYPDFNMGLIIFHIDATKQTGF